MLVGNFMAISKGITIPEKLITVIRMKYDDAKCHLHHRGKIFEDFEVQMGVRQGCILLPISFVIVISDVLHAVLSGGPGGVQWTKMSFLKYL